MKKYFLGFFALFWLFVPSLRAQALVLDSNLCKALNNYVIFANEVVQASGLMYDDFQQINLQMNAFLEQKIPIPAYDNIDVLGNYDFFTELPKNLYNQLLASNPLIAPARRKT